MQTSFTHPDMVDMNRIINQNVIIVDDSCASFKTLSAMEDFLRRSHSKALAYFVVLNRSHKSATEIRMRQYNQGFQSFYNWPITVYPDEERCLECQATTL